MVIDGCNLKLAEKLREELCKSREENGGGVSAALIMSKELIAACAVGVCGDGITQCQTDDLYDIGSVSKVYCAAAVVRLATLGKVNLDEKVIQYLPQFKMRDSRYRNITVRMLLNHSSGLPGTNSRNMITSGQPGLNRKEANHIYWQRSKLKATPGEYSVYCNEGFEIAAELVETISGMDYISFLYKEFFVPLGINSFSLAEVPSGKEHPIYMRNKKEEFVIAKGAGALRCTVEDNARFGYSFIYPDIFSSKELEELTAANGLSFLEKDEMSPWYGLGWDAVEIHKMPLDLGHHALCKGGSTLQFTSFLIVCPKYDLSIALSATYDCGFFAGSKIFKLLEIVSNELKLNIPQNKILPDRSVVPIPKSYVDLYSGIYYSSYGILDVTFDSTKLTIKNNVGCNGKESPCFEPAFYNGSLFTQGNECIDFDMHDGQAYIFSTNYNMGVPMFPMGQKINRKMTIPEKWKNRIGKTYLTCNLTLRDLSLDGPFTASIHDDENGVLSFILTNRTTISVVACSDDDTEIFVRVPGWGAMNLWAPFFVQKGKREILQIWDYDLIGTDDLVEPESGKFEIQPNENIVFKVKSGTMIQYFLPQNVNAAIINCDGELVSIVNKENTVVIVDDGYLSFICDEVISEFEIFVSHMERSQHDE